MPKKASYLPRGQRLMNAIFSTMVRLGIIPGAHLMSVPGRKSGKMRTIPLYVLRYEGQRWLVAGFAGSDWVKNVRAAAWCELIHDRMKERVQVIEVEDLEVCAAVLREFVRKAPGANRGYSISPHAPLEEYTAIVPEHPVFRVMEEEEIQPKKA
ncbi:MAG TPA: nitroreductase/quinone reductase family protein [Ktedonobacteraceae bacterium]|nr:nitroreductase/quinone reductase family protein [Ktedonobacteraceae bacterium]